jgi:hypothetical protein
MDGRAASTHHIPRAPTQDLLHVSSHGEQCPTGSSTLSNRHGANSPATHDQLHARVVVRRPAGRLVRASEGTGGPMYPLEVQRDNEHTNHRRIPGPESTGTGRTAASQKHLERAGPVDGTRGVSCVRLRQTTDRVPPDSRLQSLPTPPVPVCTSPVDHTASEESTNTSRVRCRTRLLLLLVRNTRHVNGTGAASESESAIPRSVYTVHRVWIDEQLSASRAWMADHLLHTRRRSTVISELVTTQP